MRARAWALWCGLHRAFGMLDHAGNPSFTKDVIALIVVSTCFGVVWPVMLATVVLAAAFGKSMFGAFVAKSSFALTSSDAIKLVRTKAEAVTKQLIEVIATRRQTPESVEHGTEETL